MRFKIGDHVVHQAHGLGRIVSLEKKQLSGGEARLYYQVVTQKSTVWVPVESEVEGTLRSLIARSELSHYQQILKRKPESLNTDRRLRQVELNNRLKQGSFQALCEAVRDLTAHGWRKPLSDADAALLRRISDNLCQEWAMAAGVTVAEASQLVTALMFETKRSQATA